MPDQQVQPAQQPQSQPEQDRVHERFEKIDRPLWKMILYNFLGGISWGFGVLIGTTVILAIIAFFINKNIDFVPVLGHFFAEVLKSAQNNLVPQGNIPPLQ